MKHLLMVAVFIAISPCGMGQPKDKPAATEGFHPKPREETTALIAMLKQAVDVKPLLKKQTLPEALKEISNQFGGKLPIVINYDRFNAWCPELLDFLDKGEVSLNPTPGKNKMLLGDVLRQIFSQISYNKVSYAWRRDGVLEIRPLMHDNRLDKRVPLISAAKRPLADILSDLAEEFELDIHIDPKLGDKALTPISATFRNASAETILVTITEMARLKFVELDNGIFVTTPEHAQVMGKELKNRREERERGMPFFGQFK